MSLSECSRLSVSLLRKRFPNGQRYIVTRNGRETTLPKSKLTKSELLEMLPTLRAEGIRVECSDGDLKSQASRLTKRDVRRVLKLFQTQDETVANLRKLWKNKKGSTVSSTALRNQVVQEYGKMFAKVLQTYVNKRASKPSRKEADAADEKKVPRPRRRSSARRRDARAAARSEAKRNLRAPAESRAEAKRNVRAPAESRAEAKRNVRAPAESRAEAKRNVRAPAASRAKVTRINLEPRYGLKALQPRDPVAARAAQEKEKKMREAMIQYTKAEAQQIWNIFRDDYMENVHDANEVYTKGTMLNQVQKLLFDQHRVYYRKVTEPEFESEVYWRFMDALPTDKERDRANEIFLRAVAKFNAQQGYTEKATGGRRYGRFDVFKILGIFKNEFPQGFRDNPKELNAILKEFRGKPFARKLTDTELKTTMDRFFRNLPIDRAEAKRAFSRALAQFNAQADAKNKSPKPKLTAAQLERNAYRLGRSEIHSIFSAFEKYVEQNFNASAKVMQRLKQAEAQVQTQRLSNERKYQDGYTTWDLYSDSSTFLKRNKVYVEFRKFLLGYVAKIKRVSVQVSNSQSA